MPKAPEKSMEEVADSMKRVTKLLEMHGANPAEVKAKKKEEKDLRNQEKLLIDKWVDVIDDEKKVEEKKTQTFKSMTGFIGIEARKYFAQTEKNMVTWGGLAGAIKTGVKDWFKATMQQRTMLGATLRLGASLWKATHDHLIGSIKNVFGKIASQAREVLGDLADVFDAIKGVFVGAFKFLKDTFLGVFEKVPPHQKRRNRILQKMLDYFRRREKIDLIGAGKKKGSGGLSAFMIGGMILAAILAGLVRKFLLPFEVIYRSMKIGRMVTWIKGGLSKLNIFASLFRKIKEFKMGVMLKFIVKWGKFAKFLPKIASALGLLFKAARFGFKFLGWPIQILFSLYDFIKGFMNTEGNLADKLLGGLKGVFLGFFELPVKLIGWVIEKVLGLFGIKVSGVADKILGFFMGFIEYWVAWFRPIIGFLEGFFTTEGSLIDKLKGGFKGFLGGMMDFFTYLSNKWDEFASFFGFSKKGASEGKGKGKSRISSAVDKSLNLLQYTPGIGPIIQSLKGSGGGKIDTIAKSEADSKIAQQENSTKEITKSLDKQTKDQIKANEKLAKENPAIAIGVGQGGSGGYGGGGAPPDTTPEKDDGGMVFNQNEF